MHIGMESSRELVPDTRALLLRVHRTRLRCAAVARRDGHLGVGVAAGVQLGRGTALMLAYLKEVAADGPDGCATLEARPSGISTP